MSGSPVRFRATFAGGGPSTADLKRTFKVFGPEEASFGSVRRYRVRWVYEATLLGPRALPYPGLVLRFRFSRPIRPNHYAVQGPNLSTNSPRNLQTICNNGVLNAARNATLGFDCNTYSLGSRAAGGEGWNVRASFEAIVNAGSGPISATITNAIPDRFARVQANDRTPLTAGKKIPGASGGTGSGLSLTGDWRIDFSVNPNPDRYMGHPGTFTFRQTGSTVCGRYDFSGGGTLSATVSGRAFTGAFIDRDFGRTTFQATVSADGRTWAGNWQRGNQSGRYRGTKLGAPTRRC